jgi:hypothetical protein
MSNAIIPFEQVRALSSAFHQSGYFKDATSEAQAIVKIVFGQEMGFGPAASMSGIYIIQGKPSISANLMAAAVKQSPKYDYRVREMSDDVVSIEFFEASQSIGVSKFTAEDAKRAGTQNMGKFPRNMLFARAMSNGVKWFAPDIFSGAAVYDPGELGATVDYETGEIVDSRATIMEVKHHEEHWIDGAKSDGSSVSDAFWQFVAGCGLSEQDALETLKVKDIHEFAGSAKDAKASIEAASLGRQVEQPTMFAVESATRSNDPEDYIKK